jgi:fibro-slime domain-containing protein
VGSCVIRQSAWSRSALCCLFWSALGCGSSTPTQSRDGIRTWDAGSAADSGEFTTQNPLPLGADDAGAAHDAAADASPEAGTTDKTGCGDGALQAGEACDDGNSAPGDGCSADCHSVERDFVCPAPGVACVSSVVCGDGRIAGRESCDDGNTRDADGCDSHCKLEAGFACANAGAPCAAAKCGDGIVAGDEECDDANSPPSDGDGCSASCKLEAGYVCPAKQACRKTICNDGVKEGSEACDDGNQTLGDGCTPFCEVEPDCATGTCRSRCGDGLILPGDAEECDDGNTKDHDGCSAKCRVEPGYACSLEQTAPPDTLTVPITYRDFISFPIETMQHPDFETFNGVNVTAHLVDVMLGSDGKPVYTGRCDPARQPYPNSFPRSGPCPYNQQTTTADNFAQWYRDVPNVNVTKVGAMTLMRDASGAYSINNAAFFPWDDDPHSWVGQGAEQTSAGHDYGFTSEIRTYFEYVPNEQNPQTLVFSGDDDVWVFINHRLAVDIGGVHEEQSRSIALDQSSAEALQLEAGKIYEIALFQAERRSLGSNFNLTLAGFASAHSRCQPKCGDGIVTGSETCDDAKNDGSYGSCTPDCRAAAHCGDGKRDPAHEACDDGVNVTTYAANGKPGCAPGCKWSAYCGDAEVDSMAGEECDDGTNAGGYAGCTSECRLGPRCGDHVVQRDAGESCDDGNLVNGDGCSNRCTIESPS